MIDKRDDVRLLDLIDDFVDGRLDAHGVNRLQRWLESDDAARLRYVEYVDLHGTLLRLAGHEQAVQDESLRTVGRDGAGSHWRIWAGSIAAAVACAAVWAALGVYLYQRPAAPQEEIKAASAPRDVVPPVVARLVYGSDVWRTADAAGEGLEEALEPGAELRAGDVIQLHEASEASPGTVEIRFASGARCFLTGTDPVTAAMLGITSENSCELHSGLGVFRVPPRAAGFAVVTGAGRFVDLGTEFGLSVEGFEKSEIHVLDGAVAANSARSERVLALRRGSAALLRYSSPDPQRIAFAAEKFARPASWARGIAFCTESVRFHPVRPRGLGPDVVGEPDVVHLALEASDLSAVTDMQFESAVVQKVSGAGEAGRGGGAGGESPLPFIVPAGTRFDSFVLQFGPYPAQGKSGTVKGEVRFQRPILAVVAAGDQLIQTAQQCAGYPIRTPQDGMDEGGPNRDEIRLDDSMRSLKFEMTVTPGGMDQLRVLVASEDPQP